MLLLGLAPAGALAEDAPADARSIFLIAHEDMGDPRFRETVVLVTQHGRSGSTVGVIVNRPLETTLDQAFPGAPEAAGHRLHYGGPVAQGQLVFLLRGDRAPKSSITLADRLFISSDIGSLRRILQARTASDHLRVFDGFSSWAPGQLEHEIDRGDWYLLPVDANAIFGEPPADLWQKLLRRATQRMVERAPRFFAAAH